MKRRFLSIILCLVMIIGTMPMNIMAYKAEDNQNDEIQIYADAGAAPLDDGTPENPYLITSASDLKWFSDKANGGETISVVECENHDFDASTGKCKYCGYVCKHEHIISNIECGDCGAKLPAIVEDMYDSSKIYGRYLTLEEAFASINKGETRKVVYWGNDDYTFKDDIEINGNVYYYPVCGIDLNFDDGKSFIVKDGGGLSGNGYGYISAVTLEAGSAFSLEQEFKIGTLTICDGSKIFTDTKLQNGNFEKIIIQDGDKKIGDIVYAELNYILRHKGADGSWTTGAWVTDEELESTSIENVRVVRIPFYEASIKVSPEGELTYKRALNVNMSADKTDSDGDYGETTYEWFAAHSPDNVLSTNSAYTTTLSAAGTYEFGCRITRSGYTQTVTKQIVVNKGTSGYEKEPKAKENLVYDEYKGEQELIYAGTISTGQKILYKLDDGDWSEDIPKAAEAGEYTVYYKVEENNNYNAIDVRHISVTIAKQVIKDIKTDDIVKYYDAKTDLPTGFGITKFIDSDNNEIVLYGAMFMGEYESAGAGKNKKVTITVNLNSLSKNYVFDNNTSEKVFERTGTINKTRAPEQKLGELTIIKNAKRDYTFDLSALLGDVTYGATYGKITYELDSVDIIGFYDETTGEATIDENGILTLPIQESIGTGDSDAGMITVKVITENYYNPYYDGVNITDRDITLTVTVKSMNRIPLNSSGKPILNPTSITYGQKLSDIALSGSLEDYDGNIVNGTFSWKNPDTKPSAGAASGEWIFTPDDDEFYMYETRSGTASFTVEPKDIKNAQITLADSPVYNGSEQTQTVASVKIGDMTLSERDYDISDNKATDVKADGNYVLTITGKGNFAGAKTAQWNIKPTEPTESANKKTTARVRRGRTLAEATVTDGEFLGVDGITLIDGTFDWVDSTKVISAAGTENMIFTPNNKNYAPITIDVAVNTYSLSSTSGGSSSSNTVYTVKFDTNGGSTVDKQTIKNTGTVSKPTDPSKDGFEFAGWFTDKGLKSKYDFDTKVTKNFTLYAAWTETETEPDPNPTGEPENPGKDNPFDDVDKDDWYYDDVKSVVEKGLFNGTGSKTFAPNDSITRGMFVTVLYRAEGEPKVSGNIKFNDITSGSYFANAVIWATQNGIVNGVSETEFAPNDKITREQIAAMMFRYAKYKGYNMFAAENTNILSYADFDMISEYAIEPMQYAVGGGLMKGKTENTINPLDSATRAEIAAILNRFIESNK